MGLLTVEGDWLVKILSMDGRTVKMTMAEDGDFPLEEALKFALAIAEALPEYSSTVKNIAATQLVDSYNENWREYSEKQEDGSHKTVAKPTLDTSELASLLTLTAISIYSSGLVTFWFEECELFWGHDVSVESVHGIDLNNAEANIVG